MRLHQEISPVQLGLAHNIITLTGSVRRLDSQIKIDYMGLDICSIYTWIWKSLFVHLLFTKKGFKSITNVCIEYKIKIHIPDNVFTDIP